MATRTGVEKRLNEWLPTGFLFVPLILLFFGIYWSVTKADSEREACQHSGGERHVVEGALRSASSDFYVVNNDWKFIIPGCKGKGAMQCYKNNPGIRALRDNVGSPVKVEFCEQTPVAYVIGGVRYGI